MSFIQNFLKPKGLQMPISSPSNIDQNRDKSLTSFNKTPIGSQKPSLIQRLGGVARELPGAISETAKHIIPKRTIEIQKTQSTPIDYSFKNKPLQSFGFKRPSSFQASIVSLDKKNSSNFINAIIQVENKQKDPKAVYEQPGRPASYGMMQINKQTWEEISNWRKSKGQEVYPFETSWMDKTKNIEYGTQYLLDVIPNKELIPFNKLVSIKNIIGSYNAGPSAFRKGNYEAENFPQVLDYLQKLEKNYKIPEEIQEKQQEVQQSVQYQKPSLIQRMTGVAKEFPDALKETTSEALLKSDAVRKILKIAARPDFKQFKDVFIKQYDLTPLAADLWDEAQIELRSPEEAEDPEYTKEHPSVIGLYTDKIIRKKKSGLFNKLLRIPPTANKSLIEAFESKPQIILHELGHHFLRQEIIPKDESGKARAKFMVAWNRLNKKNDYFTTQIDKIIHRYHGDTVNPSKLLSERYASIFEVASMYGTDRVAKELQPYIEPFINIKGK